MAQWLITLVFVEDPAHTYVGDGAIHSTYMMAHNHNHQ